MTFPRAPWWMYLIAASLLGNFGLSIYLSFWGPEPPFDKLNFKSQALVVEEVVPNSAGDRAGIQSGDRVLAIDGLRVEGLGQWDMTRMNFEVGKSYRLQIERDGKQFERVMSLQQRSWSRQPQYARIQVLLSLVTALLTLLAALLVAFTRPHDWVARIGALCIALLGSYTSPYGVSAICRRLPVLVGALIWWPAMGFFIFPALFFAFCTIFPRKLFRSRWPLAGALAPAVVLFPQVILAFAYFTFVNPEAKTYALRPLFTSDWWPRIGASLLFTYIGAGLVALILNYRRLDDVNQKRRIRVLVAGSLVGYLPIVPYAVMGALRASSQSDLGRALFSWPASLLSYTLYQAFPVSWAYAILRHRLFDVRVMIRRGLQYALARRLLVSAVPALAAILLLDLLLHGDQPVLAVFRARGWVYAAIAGLAAIAYARRQQWLEALDRRFFRERYNAQQLLRQTAEELRASRSLEDAAPRIVARIEAALHPEFCALMVREPNQPTYICHASAPVGMALPGLVADSKLMAAFRVFGKPLQISLSESGWLKQQLPRADTEFLRQARIELLVPVSLSATGREALLALGQKKSEEPYSGEDEELLLAIANSLALLLERPAITPASAGLEECPRCGRCYDGGAGKCTQDASQLTASSLLRLLAGRYRLDRRLGRGGMGTVYSALDTSLERQVALKLIREDLVSSAEAAERFRREAKAAAAITHPNLVTLFDFAVDTEHRAFLVMELLSGVSLRQKLEKQGRLPADCVLEILRGVCAGVAVAHQRGLIHRDLKPENIFLADNAGGEVAKILDFGLAKFVGAGESMAQVTADTVTGVLLGTPLYASPEQLKGEAVTSRWDLWALAIITYEMVSGAHPFGNPSSVAALHHAILSGRFRPLDAHLPQAPVEWQEFFSRSLGADATRRPASAGEFLAECERVFAGRRPQPAN